MFGERRMHLSQRLGHGGHISFISQLTKRTPKHRIGSTVLVYLNPLSNLHFCVKGNTLSLRCKFDAPLLAGQNSRSHRADLIVKIDFSRLPVDLPYL
jgi:hypothetical protein